MPFIVLLYLEYLKLNKAGCWYHNHCKAIIRPCHGLSYWIGDIFNWYVSQKSVGTFVSARLSQIHPESLRDKKIIIDSFLSWLHNQSTKLHKKKIDLQLTLCFLSVLFEAEYCAVRCVFKVSLCYKHSQHCIQKLKKGAGKILESIWCCGRLRQRRRLRV